MASMPPRGTIGMALAAYKLWRRLPPAQKRLVLDRARVHGPKAAAAAAAMLQSRKKSPR
jgi:hypothetical protein